MVVDDSIRLIRAQAALQTRFVERISELADDVRIEAIWLGGSVGRGVSDALSDLDVVLVMAPGGEQALVAERMSIAARCGPLALTLDSPHNAPAGGAQVNALYDIEPLPLFVDWNLWPALCERPSDVRVLFERVGVVHDSGRTYYEIQDDWPRGPALELTPARRARFGLAMIPIIAKLGIRGDEAGVLRMFEVIQEQPPAKADLATTLDSLEAFLERLQAVETPASVRCVRRFLELSRRFGSTVAGA